MHIPVLLHSSIEGLDIKEGDIFLDCTLGSGGHSSEVARRFGKTVKIIALDEDSDALVRSKEKLEQAGADFKLIRENFRNLDRALQGVGILKVNRILFDLGWSTDQFKGSGRGFSFEQNEPLVMSFKKEIQPDDLTARFIVNVWQEENLADIIYGFGEERFSRRIARAIVEARKSRPIETTFDLVEIIRKATPFFYHHGRIHFATRTFQALRIAVNDELGALTQGLEKAFAVLDSGGRMAVISFHSLEDRIVKTFFKSKKSEATAEIITKKPIVPSDEELKENPKSRSSKLRILEKK